MGMELTVKKSNLWRELQYVQGVVERKTTVPILSNLLLETVGNSLVVTATDIDVTLQCSCRAQVKVAGSVTVSARKLFEIIRLLPDADVHMKVDSADWMHMSCERARFKVAGLAKENFPDVPAVDAKTVTLPTAALRYMITRCIFAITQEESRYTLNGALLLINPGKITFVTTDGHRLVLISHPCELTGVEGETRVLVPKKTLVELGKLTADEVAEVEFGHTENNLFFRVGERLLVSRILTGQFPNFEIVIPRDNNNRVTLKTIEFGDGLRRVAVMADEQSRAVRFHVKEDQLEITSTSADFGEAKEVVSAQYSGEALEISFNAQYLLDFLGGLGTDELVLRLRDKETQGLLTPKDLGDYEYNYVVMPMKM
jgi:DNA polymerase-3 subunit beta